MIIATAGHVDHGKTTLVKALTGVNTDRLQEEQQRGMSIDLGFAYASLDGASASPVAFVDVPGHARFMRNMLAGVAAIDLALLVVAADDGPMPQTLEHLGILRLLAVPQLVVALSKVDRVSPQRLVEARAQVHALLADSAWPEAPVFAVSTTVVAATAHTTTHTNTGKPTTENTTSGNRNGSSNAAKDNGLARLRQHLANAARACAPRPALGQFRLAIDRSFTAAGAGRIVTGTVLSGQVAVGDAVVLSPSGASARVRSLQLHNRPAQLASAGQRCALNLASLQDKGDPAARGDWVLAPGAFAPTDRLDVQLQVLASEARPLNPRAQLQLHLGAAAVNVRVVALRVGVSDTPLQRGTADNTTFAPGQSGWARLVLDKPVSAAFGDRFILRDAAANRTVAGGWVLDPAGPVRGRAQPLRLQQLAALTLPDPAQALAALLQVQAPADGALPPAPQAAQPAQAPQKPAQLPQPVDLQHFAHARNLRPDELATLQQRLGLQVFAVPTGPLALLPGQVQQWRQQLLAAVAQVHVLQPDSLGPDDAALRAQLGLPASALPARAVLRGVLASLVHDGLLCRHGLCHGLPGHQVQARPEDLACLAQVQVLLQPAGLRPPIVGDLATQLSRPLADLRPTLDRLAAHGLLVRVATNRYYLPDTVEELVAHARELAAASADGSYDAAAYRDRTGIGRNLTVQVLEYLDHAGLSRFDGMRHRPVA